MLACENGYRWSFARIKGCRLFCSIDLRRTFWLELFSCCVYGSGSGFCNQFTSWVVAFSLDQLTSSEHLHWRENFGHLEGHYCMMDRNIWPGSRFNLQMELDDPFPNAFCLFKPTSTMRRRGYSLLSRDNLQYKFDSRHLIRRNAGYVRDIKFIVNEPQPSRSRFNDSDSEGQVKWTSDFDRDSLWLIWSTAEMLPRSDHIVMAGFVTPHDFQLDAVGILDDPHAHIGRHWGYFWDRSSGFVISLISMPHWYAIMISIVLYGATLWPSGEKIGQKEYPPLVTKRNGSKSPNPFFISRRQSVLPFFHPNINH
jgi:hypothetical protein